MSDTIQNKSPKICIVNRSFWFEAVRSFNFICWHFVRERSKQFNDFEEFTIDWIFVKTQTPKFEDFKEFQQTRIILNEQVLNDFHILVRTILEFSIGCFWLKVSTNDKSKNDTDVYKIFNTFTKTPKLFSQQHISWIIYT